MDIQCMKRECMYACTDYDLLIMYKCVKFCEIDIHSFILPPQWVKKSSSTYQQWRRVSSLIGSASCNQPGQQTVAVAGPWPAGCWWHVVTSSPGEAAGKERDINHDKPQGRLSNFHILKLKLQALWEEKWPVKPLHCIEGQLWIAWLDNMLLVPECLGRELDSMLSSHVKL